MAEFRSLSLLISSNGDNYVDNGKETSDMCSDEDSFPSIVEDPAESDVKCEDESDSELFFFDAKEEVQIRLNKNSNLGH